MHLLKFIPIKLTMCLILGILVGSHFKFGIQTPLITSVLLFCLLVFIFLKHTNRKSTYFGLVALLTTICLGVLAVSLWLPKNQQDHYLNHRFESPHIWKIKILEVLKPNAYSNRYIGSLLSMDKQSISGKLVLNQYRDSTAQNLQVDNEIVILGKLSEVKPPLNPYQFDYQLYLNDLGIYHQLQLEITNHFVSEDSRKTVYGAASALRNTIISKLQKANFGKEELSIIQALLLGQRNDISQETYNNYKNAGAVHILAVSGLHIGVLLLLLNFLLRPLEYLPKGKIIKLFVTVALLWGFALLAGFSASIVRAVTMFSFVAYALFLNRPSNTFNILALSMFAILLVINPMLLFQVGFQMSYAAVFAIVWVYPMLQRLWFPRNKIIRKIWQLLAVSMAAQLGVLPISLFYFHQFPGLFFVSNLIIVPALGLILGTGIITILLTLLGLLPNWLVWLYNTMIKLMNTIIEWVAHQEAFVFRNISFDTFQLLLSYGIIISFLALCTKVNFKRSTLFLGCIISFQLYTIYLSHLTNSTETLLLAHKSRKTILLNQSGNQLNLNETDSVATRTIVENFKVAQRIENSKSQALLNGYQWKGKSILVIDSIGVYRRENSDYIILTQSPRIHLERLIDSTNPKVIIADGSNYKSYILRWKKTCAKRKLPFHYTGEKGAFYFE